MTTPTISGTPAKWGVSGGVANPFPAATYAAGSGSNRIVRVAVMSAASAGAAPSSVTWGGQSLTRRDSTAVFFTYCNFSIWDIKEADFPGGASGTLNVNWAAARDECCVMAFTVQDVDQSDSYHSGSPSTGAGDADTLKTPDCTVVSATGEFVIAVMGSFDNGGQQTAISQTQGTLVDSVIASPAGYPSLAIVSAAGAASVATEVTVTTASGGIEWRSVGDGFKEATGASFVPAWAANANQGLH